MHLLLEPLLRLFASVVSHGGEPRTDRNQFGPVLVYSVRPGVTVFFLGCLAFTVFAVAADAPAFLHHPGHTLHPLQLALALVLAPVSLLMLGRTVSLDEAGVHTHSLVGAGTSILWPDLHHVERYQSRSAGKATWFLRSADTRTSITVPEMTFNTAHLLAEIRRRQPLPELPHVRRHWFGN